MRRLWIFALATGIGVGSMGLAERWLRERAPATTPPAPSAVAAPAPLVQAPADAAAVAAPAPDPAPAPVASAPPAPGAAPTGQPANDYGLTPDLQRSLQEYRSAASVEDRERPLLDLALSDEPGVLAFLLEELRGSGEQNRKQVLEAVIQYRSRDAIPELRRLAASTSLAEDRKALLDAAEYLALPTFTELRRGQIRP